MVLRQDELVPIMGEIINATLDAVQVKKHNRVAEGL